MGASQKFEFGTPEIWKLVGPTTKSETNFSIELSGSWDYNHTTENDDSVSITTRFPFLAAEGFDRYLHIKYKTYTTSVQAKLFGKPGCCGDATYDQTDCDKETQFGGTEVTFTVDYATDEAEIVNRVCIEKDPNTKVPDGDKR